MKNPATYIFVKDKSIEKPGLIQKAKLEMLGKTIFILQNGQLTNNY